MLRHTYRTTVSLRPLLSVSVLAGQDMLWLVMGKDLQPSGLLKGVQAELQEIHHILSPPKDDGTDAVIDTAPAAQSMDDAAAVAPAAAASGLGILVTLTNLESQVKGTVAGVATQASNVVGIMGDISLPLSRIAQKLAKRYVTYVGFNYAFSVATQSVDHLIHGA